jgi:signal transduction histidine kinase
MASGRILLVDDEEGVLVTMQAILEMEGYEVVVARRGEEALGLLRAQPFDLVLTDLRLDDLDGLAILAELRRRSPETPGIMLTGYASLDSAIQALREGAYDYLVKPCDVEELKAAVRRGVERRQLAQQLGARMRELEAANETIRTMNRQLQERVEQATKELRQRVVELARARDEISALHAAAQEHVKELQELDRLKSQFLSMASHELKTPLTSVSGYLQLALRRARRRLEQGPPRADEWRKEQEALVQQLETITSQTFHLARLVDELLDVSRIESGKLELRLEPVDLARLTADVAARMQLTTSQHRIRLDVPSGEGTLVSGDRDYLEQVLSNLIGNAIKYSPAGGPIDVEVRPAAEQVQLSVRDQGVGISPEELDKVFTLFYRSRESSAQQASGMGLGLYISREIVTRHGGQIWVESWPGHGSTFYVSLPRLRQDAAGGPQPPASRAPGPAVAGSPS